ncbi:hypothetical protein Pan216_55320 [Planctomycetes bacterium Pan216]|uniref:Uncharacterized protein n=1 Tax=Kolteria novifilia TaxID=2527975 RepID=A0A518BCD4_9BACT|nr:hypothetical protein Pan216_55320 [Planctomycetes bacterium Pan216]
MTDVVMSSSDAAPGTREGTPKRRWRRWWLYPLGLVLVALVAWGLWNRSLSSELSREIAKIRARGEPVTFAELAPAPVDPDDDATEIVLTALNKIQQRPFNDILAVEPPLAGDKLDTLRQAIAANQGQLDGIAQGLRRPHFRLPLDYTDPMPMPAVLTLIKDFRTINRVLRAQILVALAEGETDVATDSVLLGLRVGERLRDEPLLIVQLLRTAMGTSSLRELQLLLGERPLPPAQRDLLRQQLATIEADLSLRRWFLRERALVNTSMAYLPTAALTGAGRPPGFLRMVLRLPVQGLFDAQRAQMLRTLTEVAEIADVTGPEGDEAVAELEARIVELPDFFNLIKLQLPALVQARTAGLRYRQRLRLALIAIHLDASRREGQLPNRLEDALDPSTTNLALGIFSDKPIRYQATDDAFLLYNLGPNGHDDGIDEATGQRLDENEVTFQVRYRTPAKETSDE